MRYLFNSSLFNGFLLLVVSASILSCGGGVKEPYRDSPNILKSDYVLPIVKVAAKQTDTAGWVLFEYEIDSKGKVRNPVVLDSYPKNKNIEEASAALTLWKFHPKHNSGKNNPKKYKVVINVNKR